MSRLGMAVVLLSICLTSGCASTATFDDVSSVPVRDRPALQQCLAIPDLPGNQWPKNTGKATCWLIPGQDPSLQEITTTLAEPDGAARLDLKYQEILTAHYRDPLHRDALFRAYLDFQKPSGRQVAATWLAKSPHSPFAMLAAGDAALGAARLARGGAYANQTSQAQFDAMGAQLEVAIPLLQAALQARPTLSPACVDLMHAALLESDDDVASQARQQCLKVDPLSMHVNLQWLVSLDPNWGGSYDQLDEAIEQIRTHVVQSPLLGSLLAASMGPRAYRSIDDDAPLAPIAAQLEHVALVATDPFYISMAGQAAEQAGDNQKALLYASQAVRFAPDNVDYRAERGKINLRMGDRLAALDDARKAAAAPDDPCGCQKYDNLASLFRDLRMVPEQRQALRKSIASSGDHRWAMQQLCNSYFRGFDFDREPGLACTKEYIDAYPDDAGAIYLRALTLYIVHDPAAAAFDARYRQLADPNDPDTPRSVQQLDRLKLQQGH